jgi:hypothetical protein
MALEVIEHILIDIMLDFFHAFVFSVDGIFQLDTSAVSIQINVRLV